MLDIIKRKRHYNGLIPMGSPKTAKSKLNHTQPILQAGGELMHTHGSQNNLMQNISQISHKSNSGTLNFVSRKKELERINQDNVNLWKTLNDVQPTYHRFEWKLHKQKVRLYVSHGF